jgi:hypothetical protein
MAAKDNLSHEVLGSFTRRIAPARAGCAAENIAYGYESCCGMSETCPEAVVPQGSYSAIAIRRPSIALELPDEFLQKTRSAAWTRNVRFQAPIFENSSAEIDKSRTGPAGTMPLGFMFVWLS